MGIKSILILSILVSGGVSFAQYEPNPILPDTIFLTLGNDIELYNDNVAFVRLDNSTYTFDWDHDVGSTTTTKWFWTANQLGNFNLRFKVYQSGAVVDDATAIIKVLPKESGHSFTMLAIGNSLTSNGFYYQLNEAQADLDIDLSSIGTQGGSPAKHEGYPGWKFANHMESASPFYFDGAIDFNQYLSTHSFPRPEIVRIYLGINDCFLNSTMEYVQQTAVNLIQKVRADFPQTLVLVAMPTLCENTGTGWTDRYGDLSNYERYQLRIRELWQYLLDSYSGSNGSDWVQVSYEGLCVDRYNGYPMNEGVHTDGVHPNELGYRQLSRGFSNTLNRFAPILYEIKDTEPPTIPGGLSLIGSTSSSLNFSWNPSTDNVAVIDYRIFLDNVFAGTTSSTTYTISGLSPGTSYSMTVSAVDAESNESAKSNPLISNTLSATDTEAPSVPVGLKLSGRTHNSILLTWLASSDNVGVTGYRAFLDDKEVGTTAGPTFTYKGLNPGSEYYLSVTSYDEASNESARSLALSVRTLTEIDTEAPTTPTAIEAIKVSSSSFEIIWSPSTDNQSVAGYRVFIDGIENGTSVSTTYVATGINPSTEYMITVSAYDATLNESSPSLPLLIQTESPDTIAPTTPEGLVVTSVTGTHISLSWNQSTDNVKLEGYRIYLNGEEMGTSVINQFVVTGLLPETQYSITVTAYDESSNESPHSSAIVATTESPNTTPPSVPTGLIASVVTENTISLIWDQSTDDIEVSGYYIYLDNLLWGTSLSNSLTLTKLEPGTEYSIHVSAFDANGNESNHSNTLIVTTSKPDTAPPSIPENLVTSTVGMTTIGIAWSPSSDNLGVTGYNVFANGLIKGSTPSNAFTLTQLEMGLEYRISVSAFDHAGNESEFSTPIQVTTFNPDSSSNPSFPVLSIIHSQQVNDRVRILTRLSSYGFTQLQNFGMLVREDTMSMNEAWFLSPDPDEVEIVHKGRVTDNLQVLYEFSRQNANTIFDIAGTDEPYNLFINPLYNSEWMTAQGLKVFSNSVITSDTPALALTDSLKATNELTIEAWIKPSQTNQEDGANIISLSSETGQQVVSLTHAGNQGFYDYKLRLQTTGTDQTGNPEVSTSRNYINPELQHVVYSRNHTGEESIYVNGSLTYYGVRNGSFASWDEEYHLELGNFQSDKAPWSGTYYLTAIYNRYLQASEVLTNYNSGFGNILFNTELKDLTPGITYHLHPMALTDQGIVYGPPLTLTVNDEEFPDGKDSLQMKVYPNPSNGNFTIYFEDISYSTGNALLRISDLSGQVVYAENISLADAFYSKELKVDLSSSVADGFYSVMLFIGPKAAARKLIIQN